MLNNSISRVIKMHACSCLKTFIYIFVYLYISYACILLLGVSSRVLFWPTDKGKGKVDQPWAWRTWTLVHVGQLHGISMCCSFLFWVHVFVVRRQVCFLCCLNYVSNLFQCFGLKLRGTLPLNILMKWCYFRLYPYLFVQIYF